MEPEIDDVADAKGLNFGKLLFGRLARCRDAVVETMPAIDRFGIGHATSP